VGPELCQVYNDGYRRIIAEKHPEGLGQPTRECWSEVWHINEPIYERVLSGETLTSKDKLFPITRHGYLEDAWFTLCYSPLRDEQGAVAGVLVSAFETTEGHRADAALEESEARYRAFVTASSDVVYRMGPDWSAMRRLDGRGFISDTAEPTEDWMERYIHPDDRALVRSAIEEAVRTKGVFELEHRVVRVDGTPGVNALAGGPDPGRGRRGPRVARDSERRHDAQTDGGGPA
jgi:PAS domain-containing protein